MPQLLAATAKKKKHKDKTKTVYIKDYSTYQVTCKKANYKVWSQLVAIDL